MSIAMGNVAAERMVIAWYLVLQRDDVRKSSLQADHFVDLQHGQWWRWAQSRGDFTPFDLPGIRTETVAELSDVPVYGSRQIATAERAVVRGWALHRAFSVAGGIVSDIKAGRLDDPSEVSSRLRELSGEVEKGSGRREIKHGTAAARGTVEWVKSWSNRAESAPLIPMPIPSMERHCGGWPKGKLIIIGARSSEHKTTLARSAAWHAANHGQRVLYWTMEDSSTDIAMRTVADVTKGVTLGMIHRHMPPAREDCPRIAGDMERHTKGDAAQLLAYLDQACPTLPEVLGSVRAASRDGIDMLVIDYVQLIQNTSNRDRDADFWRRVSSSLAMLAKELSCCVVATSQIDKVGTRNSDGGTAPRASDMLFSSALIQDAYGVMMLKKIDGPKPKLEINIEKWKSAGKVSLVCNVEPAKDRVRDP